MLLLLLHPEQIVRTILEYAKKIKLIFKAAFFAKLFFLSLFQLIIAECKEMDK